MDELELWIQQARASIEAGRITPAKADTIMSRKTAGQYKSVREAEQALAIHNARIGAGVPSEDTPRWRQAISENLKQGGRELKGLGLKALQGVSLGQMDEAAGAAQRGALPGTPGFLPALLQEKLQPSPANEAMDKRLQQASEQMPIAAPLFEAAGGMLTPGGPFRQAGSALKTGLAASRAGRVAAAGQGARTVLKGIGSAAARSGAAGAGYGGLYAFGAEDDPDKLLQTTLWGGAAGGLGGAMLGAAAKGAQRVKAVRGVEEMRVDDLADELAEMAGQPGGLSAEVRAAARARVQKVKDDYYAPLDAKFGEVKSLTIKGLLNSNPFVRRAVSANGLTMELKKRAPSLAELQRIRNTLGKLARSSPENAAKYGPAHATLDKAMQDAVEGLAQADEAFAGAMAGVRAFSDGTKLWSKPAELIREGLAGIQKAGGEEAVQNARAAMLQRYHAQLSKQGGIVKQGDIDKLLASGMEPKIMELFPTPAQYQAWRQQLAVYDKALLNKQQLDKLGLIAKNTLKWGSIAVATGGAAYAGVRGGMSLFGLQ